MRIIECEQLSPSWWEARRGIPTASEFGRILTPRKMELAAAADDLIDELIAQRFSPATPGPQYTSRAAQNGQESEPEARRWFEFQEGVKVQQIGFCLSDCGRFGASPDGLLGEDGGIEIKCAQGKTHVRWLRQGGIPPEHLAQVHGSLIVTGRPHWYFLAYCPGFPPLCIKAEPNSFTEKLRSVLEVFYGMYMERLKQFDGTTTADTLRLAIADVEAKHA